MGSFFANLSAKLREFMMDRNGGDTLATWVIIAALIFSFINIFLPNAICTVLSWVLLLYAFFRIFSKNVPARRAENEKFENLIHKVRSKGSSKGKTNKNSINKNGTNRSASSGTTLYFKCEGCGQQLSVPRGKGTLKVTCPKCKFQTKIKS